MIIQPTNHIITSYLHLWERLQIIVGEPGREGIYNCRVTDIHQDYLTVSRPEFGYGNSLLANNSQVLANYTRTDATYCFVARLVECEPKSDREMLLVDLSKVERNQRRRFVRLQKSYRLNYKVIDRPLTTPVDSNDDMIPGRTINMSAGGMLMVAKKPIETDSVILLDLSPARLTSVPDYIMGVCRQSRSLDSGKPVAGIEFIVRDDLHYFFKDEEIELLPVGATVFDMRQQNHLVNELFTEQLSMRRNGLL